MASHLSTLWLVWMGRNNTLFSPQQLLCIYILYLYICINVCLYTVYTGSDRPATYKWCYKKTACSVAAFLYPCNTQTFFRIAFFLSFLMGEGRELRAGKTSKLVYRKLQYFNDEGLTIRWLRLLSKESKRTVNKSEACKFSPDHGYTWNRPWLIKSAVHAFILLLCFRQPFKCYMYSCVYVFNKKKKQLLVYLGA